MRCFDFASRIEWFKHLPTVLAEIVNAYIGPELFGRSVRISHPEYICWSVRAVIGNDVYWHG